MKVVPQGTMCLMGNVKRVKPTARPALKLFAINAIKATT